MSGRFATLLALMVLLIPAGAAAQTQIGHGDSASLRDDPTSNCAIGSLCRNDDGSAENGYSWDFAGTQEPYYGAFAESYDLGPGTVSCGAYWFTQIGYFYGRPMDAYVWEGGVTGEPGAVLCMLPQVVPTNVPFWPDCGKNDFSLDCDVTGEFTVGYWADFSDHAQEWFICADENGPGGHPWTCIAPGIGYPSGWQPVTVVFEECRSLLIGAHFIPREPSGVEELPIDAPPAISSAWGRVKTLFR
ncbi:MAG: hypothetical protein GF330_11925 [Candidatus Eisenbacteria bacterium]|nr:hypothetical protein [Candidatus Eisenbacteria bacterium]